jgi:hypothetical protein
MSRVQEMIAELSKLTKYDKEQIMANQIFSD